MSTADIRRRPVPVVVWIALLVAVPASADYRDLGMAYLTPEGRTEVKLFASHFRGDQYFDEDGLHRPGDDGAWNAWILECRRGLTNRIEAHWNLWRQSVRIIPADGSPASSRTGWTRAGLGARVALPGWPVLLTADASTPLLSNGERFPYLAENSLLLSAGMEADTDIPGGRVGFGTSAVYRADLSAAADRDIRLIWRACVEADVTARWTLIAAADGRVTLSGGEDLVSHRYTQLSAGAKWQALRHLQLEALAAVMGEGKNAGAGHGFSAGLRTDF